jgi:DNA repair photolyase
VLELLTRCRHPFTIVTKSSLVERDLDLIAPMANANMARVYVSITTLDKELARKLEPRAATPRRRLQTVATLAAAGVPVGVLVAPIIPQLNDRDLETIVAAAANAGAQSAGWVMLRLPLEVAPLFRAWLDEHYPQRAAHIMSLVRQIRGGRDYDSQFTTRMRGTGTFAELIARRFRIARDRAGMGDHRSAPLDTSQFVPPCAEPDTDRQSDLFR